MNFDFLPADLRKMAKTVMSETDWKKLGAAWEMNKRNNRKDSLNLEQINEIRFLLQKGTSVRETASIVEINRGRVWYIYKQMMKEGDIRVPVKKQAKVKSVKKSKKRMKAENFI